MQCLAMENISPLPFLIEEFPWSSVATTSRGLDGGGTSRSGRSDRGIQDKAFSTLACSSCARRYLGWNDGGRISQQGLRSSPRLSIAVARIPRIDPNTNPDNTPGEYTVQACFANSLPVKQARWPREILYTGSLPDKELPSRFFSSFPHRAVGRMIGQELVGYHR